MVGRGFGSVHDTVAPLAAGGSPVPESAKTAVHVPSYAALLPPSPKQPDNKSTTNIEIVSSRNSVILNFIIKTP
jgi:hypothetical protein